MAAKRVTMKEIADACGLSRNTVSKIFNDRGAVSDSTRRTVLEKAKELGYYQIPDGEPVRSEIRSQNVALLTTHLPEDSHFGTAMLPAFTGRLSRAGYTLMMYELSGEDVSQRRLPEHLSLEQTAGIIGIELFDRAYIDMLSELGLPTVFVDAYAGANAELLKFDFISMENTASTLALTRHLISMGARRLGFVGDAEHCNSFHERWTAFCAALADAGLPLNRELCILERDNPDLYIKGWFRERLLAMPELPDALVCANDFIAIHLMTALKQTGIPIPGAVMVAGFDGTPLSAVVEPSLTTVQIPCTDIGRLAADMLLERIENPGLPFRSTYVKTTPIWRDSTSLKRI